MARKQITGLTQKGGIWHVNKVVKGQRIHESTGTSSREEAERYLIHRLEKLREQQVYGVRTVRTWREAAARFLVEFKDQPSIDLSATYLEQLDQFIGDLPLTHVDDESLAEFIEYKQGDHILPSGRKGKPASNRTINIALQRVVRVLNLCQRKWRDEQKRPWLDVVPMVAMLSEKGGRKPYPLDWEEQRVLFKQLPDHLLTMALYKVNTGCREQEVCKLRWDYEVKVPELGTSVFLIPEEFGGRHANSGVKNRETRVVILNDVAKSVIESQRGLDKVWVFPFEGRPLHRMNDTAWRNARYRAAKIWEKEKGTPAHPGFETLRVHDLKHTFGRRLKAADVSTEDRKNLLGHKIKDITELYSSREIGALIKSANKVTATDSRSPVLTVLKLNNTGSRANTRDLVA
jgi:integrase